MRVLLDQGLPRSAALLPRDRGIDALHTGECGLFTAADSAILEHARDQGRIVVTLDSDFHALMALSSATSPSVLRIRIEGLRAAAASELIQMVLTRCRADLEAGALVSVTETRIRVRVLPIGRTTGGMSRRGSSATDGA
ncbi:MAG: DUF5615 family PIN-like protein [Phycisphaerae bacterium]|nr:DUF5615 family PIN-like protein [Phycisphaerae bacterium]